MDKPTHWLLKTEPETYSLSQLQKDKKTGWNGVRNFQARNFLKQVQVGDLALIYHSGDERAVVGLAEVTRAAYPDPDPKKPGEWFQIEIRFHKTFPKPVELKTIKATPELKDMQLIKQSRLSVMPISDQHYRILLKMGGASK